jgi:hypothetical protein
MGRNKIISESIVRLNSNILPDARFDPDQSTESGTLAKGPLGLTTDQAIDDTQHVSHQLRMTDRESPELTGAWAARETPRRPV